jgi:hypothetical protein
VGIPPCCCRPRTTSCFTWNKAPDPPSKTRANSSMHQDGALLLGTAFALENMVRHVYSSRPSSSLLGLRDPFLDMARFLPAATPSDVHSSADER